MNFKNHVTRLSQCKSILKRMQSEGITQVHAETLANAVGVTPAQIRKDFSIFGIRGNKRGGYQVKALFKELRAILGLEQDIPVILVGYGNLGKAIIRHAGFHEGCTKIVAAFDPLANILPVGTPVPVYSTDMLPEYVMATGIKHAILAVPDAVAQKTIDILYDAGIRGFMNFSTIPLKIPDDAYMNNVDLELELETVIFYTKQASKIDQ